MNRHGKNHLRKISVKSNTNYLRTKKNIKEIVKVTNAGNITFEVRVVRCELSSCSTQKEKKNYTYNNTIG